MMGSPASSVHQSLSGEGRHQEYSSKEAFTHKHRKGEEEEESVGEVKYLDQSKSTLSEEDAEEEVYEPFVPFLVPRELPKFEEVDHDSKEDEIDYKACYLPRGCKLVPGEELVMATFIQKTGFVVPEDLQLCSLKAIAAYPENFIGEGNRERVSTAFFDKGKLFERKWNIFYIYPGYPTEEKVILLVPTAQFENFLSEINEKLDTHLAIPSGGAAMSFRVNFPDDGTRRPRYFGESTDKEMADQLKTTPPPRRYNPDGAADSFAKPSDRSIEAYRKKIDALLTNEKIKKAKAKANKRKGKNAQKQSWGDAQKRVQRYLGLREKRPGHHQAMREGDAATLSEGAYDTAIAAALANPDHSMELNVNLPSIFLMEGDIVFVCVDIEANERNHNQITEIGIATLDTRDIASLAPGEGGKNWINEIRARHFRIQEYAYIRNRHFVVGCPDKFEFGESEFVSLKDVPGVVASCFKEPFSGPAFEGMERTPKRTVVLVGHDTMTDVKYLQNLGYDVLNLPPHEIVDTAGLYRYLCRDNAPGSLGSILADLGIAGWNLHNAGNDAVYTLQAMLAISVKAIQEGDARIPGEIDEERIIEAVEQARRLALEDQQGWSDDGGDGGDPAKPPTVAGKAKGPSGSPPGSSSSPSSGWPRSPAYNKPNNWW